LSCSHLRDSWIIGLPTTLTSQTFFLDNIDALTAYVRVGFSNEDVKGKNVYALIKLDQLDKFLHEYTQDFNNF
jgi:hypothetical protein